MNLIHLLLESLGNALDSAQQWVFAQAIEPFLLAVGAGHFLEDGYIAAAWFVWGCLEVLVICCVIVPLEKRNPVEPIKDRATLRVDVLYTLVHRLGLFRLVFFFAMYALQNQWDALTPEGWRIPTWHLDQILPGISDVAWVSFLLYLIAFDFANYWIHRAQHGLRLWWALHSLHHAQRQMTVWSDNRNHLLDDAAREMLVALLGLLIGVSPAQFVGLVACTQLMESLQHANLKLSFGRVGNGLLVSPSFHRVHHSIEHGFAKNFGVLFTWWDALFGTAKWESAYLPTGVNDGQDYGRGLLAQQWLGFKRLYRLCNVARTSGKAQQN